MAKHRTGRLKRFMAGMAVILLLAVLFLALPPLHLQSLEVSDLNRLQSEEVIAASGLEIGQHLLQGMGGSLRQWFSLRYGSAEQAITDRFPYVRTVQVSVTAPGRVQIAIEERIEVAYVAIPDGCVMIDKEGYALRINPVIPDDIPVIEGISVSSLSLGKALEVDVQSSMESAVTLMGAVIDADKDTRTTVNLLAQIHRIRPIGTRSLYITLILPASGDELTVKTESGEDLTEDMNWLRFALAQGVLEKRGKGVLDLTGSKKVFIPDA